MKKSDLKTGMIVTTRDGCEYVVFLGTTSVYIREESCDILLNTNPELCRWNRLDYYNEDLTYDRATRYEDDAKAKEYDIMKVELALHPYAFTNVNYKREERKLLWEREKPVKEMTMAELEEHFGCKVKIVKELER